MARSRSRPTSAGSSKRRVTGRGARFERRGEATLAVASGRSEGAVSILTPRIVRVQFESKRQTGWPYYVLDREWGPAPFEVVDAEPLLLRTTDLTVEIARHPLRLAFIDPRGDWLLRQPAGAGLSSESTTDAPARHGLRLSFAFSG